MTTRSKVTVACILGGVALLGFRVWWVWPKALPGGPFLESIEVQSDGYSLNPKADTTLSQLVDLSIFRGYSPDRHFEFNKEIDDQPSKYVKGRGRHYYVEYIVAEGRMQFHNDYSEEVGAAEWMEFVPTHLPADRFFDSSIAIAFDLSRERFFVYVLHKAAKEYMTVYVNRGLVERIAWQTH